MGDFSRRARAGVVAVVLVATPVLAACGSGKTTSRAAGPGAPTTASTVAANSPTTKSATTQSPKHRSVTRKKVAVKKTRPKARTTTSAPSATTPTQSPIAPPAPSASAASDRSYNLVSRHGLFLFGPSTAARPSTLRVLGKEGQVCWSFAPGVAHKTAGQIDTGAPGTTSTTVLSFGKTYQMSGCVTAKASIIAGLVKYPAAYYVSVHGGV